MDDSMDSMMGKATLKEVIELGEDLTRAFFKEADNIDGNLGDQSNAIMSALGQILGTVYVKIENDFGAKVSENWVEQIFRIAQVFTQQSGKEIHFAFIRKEDP